MWKFQNANEIEIVTQKIETKDIWDDNKIKNNIPCESRVVNKTERRTIGNKEEKWETFWGERSPNKDREEETSKIYIYSLYKEPKIKIKNDKRKDEKISTP